MNLKKILGKCIPLGLILACSSTDVPAKSLPQDNASVTISVFNEAGISAEVLSQAEKVSSRVFEESGIHVDWVNCSTADEPLGHEAACFLAAFPDHLDVHILRRSLNLRDSILGVSYLSSDGRGCQADIFYEGVERMRRESFVSPTVILGHVIAHEIGHLLLGMNSHSAWGIMRAHWDRQELARANRCMLLFTESQSHRMTQTLHTAQCLSVNVTGLSEAEWSLLIQLRLIAPQPFSKE